MEDLLDGSERDRWNDKCKIENPNPCKKVEDELSTCKKDGKTPDECEKLEVKLDTCKKYYHLKLLRCIARKVGLVVNYGTGQLGKKGAISRINSNSKYSTKKKRYLRNLMTKCHYWDACRKDYCVN